MSLEAKRAKKFIEEVLVECEEYFDDKSGDTDNGEGGTVGNAEARLHERVEKAKEALKAVRITMTAAELIERVRAIDASIPNVPEGIKGNLTAIELTCRFIAVKEAEDIRDAWSTKDYVDLIVEGEALGGPYKTEADIQGWINRCEENEPWIEWDEWLDTALEDFLGIAVIAKALREVTMRKAQEEK